MKSRVYLFVVFLLVLIAYVSGCRKAGKWLVKKDDLVHADAIVILMGSIADRVLQAEDVYKLGMSDKVIMVEASMGAYKVLEDRGTFIISNTKQVRDAIVALGIQPDNISILPGDANSTQMEAIIIRDYLKDKPGVDTLILISSAAHTRRASMIFESAFRKVEMPVHVSCSPSIYTNFEADKWWQSKEGIQIVFFEYLKLANFFLFERRQL